MLSQHRLGRPLLMHQRRSRKLDDSAVKRISVEVIKELQAQQQDNVTWDLLPEDPLLL